ncbi:glycosyltransferase family 39 protein [Halospeciosus flavus]|uniref:ArnT family glycosyltransferase n=1 Tax=Halospeciosus flavus TaxID=3032283 RepID=A0ABD5Z2R7_9EURY|nr:glycosyltransferase family 39 protein [Halospeciosus flavus]
MVVGRVRTRVRASHGALALAAVAGLTAFLVSLWVFPYHSINHDEGVYLQQAAMLLEGKLYLRPPVEEAFDPWFFVDAESPNGPAVPVPERSGDVLYPKYAPPTAIFFALGKLLGGFRLALVGVAAACVYLTYAVTREVFDARTGLLAGAFLLASPMFLVQVGTFLPYAPTTAFNLLFALAYFRAEREGSVRWAAIAGGAVGVAFFARPYTAVLFATPFITHAVWTVWKHCTVSTVFDEPWRDALVRRRVATAGLGLVGVAVTLGYNAILTGHAFVFPYQAFAPLDGLGFGHRQILGHDVNYTVELALRANRQVVETLFTEWVVGGPVGTLLAAVGVGLFLARRDDWRRGVLAGLFVSVIVGNVAFWGNLNVLGGIADPDDGLVYFLGPYYHFDLLVPTAAFAAHGLLTGTSEVHERVDERIDGTAARRVAVAFLLVTSAVVAGAAANEAAPPLQRNDQVSQQLAMGYEPFVERDLQHALVYLPTPYGPWLNHPFQELRNDPGFDGDVVYALDGIRSFDVAATFENRTKYRYVYRGSWVPTDNVPVESTLQRVRVARGERVVVDAAVGLPAGTESASLRLGTEEGHAYYAVNGTPEELPFRVVVEDGAVRLRGDDIRRVGVGSGPVAIDDRDSIEVAVFVDRGPGAEFSYRLRLPVERTGGEVRAITPYLEYCDRPRLCGGEAAYVGETPRGVFVEAQLANTSTA